jgi:hypothetical protein
MMASIISGPAIGGVGIAGDRVCQGHAKNNPDVQAGSTQLRMTTCPTITADVPAPPVSHVPELPAAEIEAAADYAKAEKAEATCRAYKTDFAIFEAWCAERRTTALPAVPAAVCAFLAFEADRGIKPSTLSRRHPPRAQAGRARAAD